MYVHVFTPILVYYFVAKHDSKDQVGRADAAMAHRRHPRVDRFLARRKFLNKKA